MITSYPKIHTLGHRDIRELLRDPVIIEEKIDGSQFSFSFTDEKGLVARSRGGPIDPTNKMFSQALSILPTLDLRVGWTYRGEYLNRPKHNVLNYERIPEKFIILFDIQNENHDFLFPEEREQEAGRVGLETVPILHRGMVDEFNGLNGISFFNELLKRKSVLGGVDIEGVVVKNRARGLIGKFVSDAFKEKMTGKERAPRTDPIDSIVGMFRTQARWDKAIQHCRDEGKLTGRPEDIGLLMKELNLDINDECQDDIKDVLFSTFFPSIRKQICHGFAEYYKRKLAEDSFAND